MEVFAVWSLLCLPENNLMGKILKVPREVVSCPDYDTENLLTVLFSHGFVNLSSVRSLPHSTLLNRPDRQGHCADALKRNRGSVLLGVGSTETLKHQTDAEDDEDQKDQSCINLFSQRHLGKSTHTLPVFMQQRKSTRKLVSPEHVQGGRRAVA